MNNYSKGVIYTVRYRNDDSLIYVGSTIQPLYKRWHQHKQVCFNKNKTSYNYKIYQKIRDTNDIDNWYIELYENYPCESIQELRKREGEVIREIGNLNIVINGRTKQEYRDDNKDIILQKAKEYYETNKDKIKEKRNENFNCDCGGCYIYNSKSRHYKTKKHIDYENNKTKV